MRHIWRKGRLKNSEPQESQQAKSSAIQQGRSCVSKQHMLRYTKTWSSICVENFNTSTSLLKLWPCRDFSQPIDKLNLSWTLIGSCKSKSNKPRPTLRKAHTFSFDCMSRDFLLARTCKWLETCRTVKQERRKRKRGRGERERSLNQRGSWAVVL